MASNEDRRRHSLASLPVRVWRSVFRGPIIPRTDRERRLVVFNHLLLHLRPMRLPEPTLRYTHTFGLGGMSAVLVTLLVITGTLMMFRYEPSPERAYDSVRALEEAQFGVFLRGVHYWSANLVILVVTLHLLRVFLTGGFHGARQFNWIIGLCLLGCVLLSNFTGYLLPWDQLSYWAITICTAMVTYVPWVGEWLQQAIRGGDEIGARTIIVFYALHTTISPVMIVALMAFHFWRVRKAGGVVLPPSSSSPPGPPRYVLFIPNLLVRETVVALLLVALVFLAALVAGAPLGERANPGLSPNPAKAPWYFLGLQELLLHFHPVVAVLVLPLFAIIALVSIPYLAYETEIAGAWFLTRRGKKLAGLAAVLAMVLTPSWIVLDELAVDLGVLAALPPWLSGGLVPCAVLIAVLGGFYAWVKRRRAATRSEAVQALFVFVAVAFAVLTVAGIWFRGEGMTLVWPWAAAPR